MNTEDACMLVKVADELKEIRKVVGPFASDHEAYGVLLEEVDELWDEIKKKYPCRDRIRAEAIQVAAVAIRLAVDLT